MKLIDLLQITYEHLQGSLETEIKDICYDSRQITNNSLFICLTGTNFDGHEYIDKAVRKGATAIIIEKPITFTLPPEIALISVPNTRQVFAELSCVFFGHPSQKFPLVGITGTNGKTSTTNIAAQLLQDTGTIGTLGAQLNGQSFAMPALTTPESSDLQKILHSMHSQDAKQVIIEVSSVALTELRVHRCDFDVGVFTNFSSDHLDYHSTMDAYLEAKLRLFPMCTHAIINLDDPFAPSVVTAAAMSERLTYGINNCSADLYASNIKLTTDKTECTIHYKQQQYSIIYPLIGTFNVYNVLAAIAIGLSLGYPINQLLAKLSDLKSVPGRSISITVDAGFSVVIDYAHTEDALQNILHALRPLTSGRLITVFGCGGNRDRSKRPFMGKVAGELSDHCIITSDNPRDEDPLLIIAEIENGIKSTKTSYQIIEDRKQAIEHALQIAAKDDTILIAGKGHEDYQEITGVKHKFSDQEVVSASLDLY